MPEVVESSVTTPNQILLTTFMKLKSATQTASIKLKHFDKEEPNDTPC